MRKIPLLALIAFAAIVAVAYAVTPTATVDSTTDTTATLGHLDCQSTYKAALRKRNPDGTYSAAQTLTFATKDCAAPPPPPPSGTEPAPIAGQGYHEAFRDDFNTLDRSVWDYCIWYDCDAPENMPTWASTRQVVQNGVLHLKAYKPYDYLDTITTQTSGKTFQYGYFEARMKWPAGRGSWPGFWLYSYKHATDASQCTTQAGEIDVMEGQGAEPNAWYGTVHSNTNGCNPQDVQNGNNWQGAGVDLTAGFHTYAVKWTPSTVTWYLDGVQTHSAPTYPTDNQPMFLLLQEWTGGWMGDPDATTPDPLDNQIDYVTVWQQ
jgi:beta-glucanase (GH16 family)